MSYVEVTTTGSPQPPATSTDFASVAQLIAPSSSSSSLSGDSAVTDSSQQQPPVKETTTRGRTISPSTMTTPSRFQAAPTGNNRDGTAMETNASPGDNDSERRPSPSAARHQPYPYPQRADDKSIEDDSNSDNNAHNSHMAPQTMAQATKTTTSYTAAPANTSWARPAPAAAHPGHLSSRGEAVSLPPMIPPYAMAVPQPVPASNDRITSNPSSLTMGEMDLEGTTLAELAEGPTDCTGIKNTAANNPNNQQSMTTMAATSHAVGTVAGPALTAIAKAAPLSPSRFSGVPLSLSSPHKARSPGRSPSTPGKKRPSAVQQVDRLELPSTFWSQSSQSHQESPPPALTRLVGLFQSAGSEEQSNLYYTWTNPEYKPTFQDFLFQPPPSKAPPTRSPHDFATPARRSRRNGSDVDTMAEHVHYDSRAVEFHEKQGMVVASVADPVMVKQLERARFRDYQLLAPDDFVKTCPERKPPRSASKDSQNRRRAKSPADNEIRVGRQYQATVPPRPDVGGYRKRPALVPECDQLWDPKLAREAQLRGEDIDGFLSQGTDLNATCLLMEALHRGGYNVENATDEFISLYRRAKEPSTQLRLDEIFVCKELFAESKKNFREVARRTKRSIGAVLVQYYHWKGANEGDCYTKLKREMKADSDWCAICDDGGKLIVCDHCHRGYHLECLPTKLKDVPKDEWYCYHCVKSPALFRKLPPTSPPGEVVPPPAKKRLIFSDSALPDNNALDHDDCDKKPAAPENGPSIPNGPVDEGVRGDERGMSQYVEPRLDPPNVAALPNCNALDDDDDDNKKPAARENGPGVLNGLVDAGVGEGARGVPEYVEARLDPPNASAVGGVAAAPLPRLPTGEDVGEIIDLCSP